MMCAEWSVKLYSNSDYEYLSLEPTAAAAAVMKTMNFVSVMSGSTGMLKTQILNCTVKLPVCIVQWSHYRLTDPPETDIMPTKPRHVIERMSCRCRLI